MGGSSIDYSKKTVYNKVVQVEFVLAWIFLAIAIFNLGVVGYVAWSKKDWPVVAMRNVIVLYGIIFIIFLTTSSNLS